MVHPFTSIHSTQQSMHPQFLLFLTHKKILPSITLDTACDTKISSFEVLASKQHPH